ncbi:MAG: M16 family metallopeptidase [Saprospiraceae bacterium]
MKRIFSIIALGAVLAFAACSPKSGGKMADSKPAGKTTTIPIPTGDVRKNAPKPGPAPSINIGKAETFTLENGLKVIVVENHKLPRVSFQIFVDADPVLEKSAVGYVELMGELLSKGTATRTKAQIDEEVDFIGASLGTSERGVTGECLSRHSDKLLTLMSDVLLHPVFPEEELKKAKTRQASNLAQSKDNANAIAANVGAILRNGKQHPYGEIMTEASLEKITLDQIKKHYQTYFKPNVSYLVIVGDVTKSKAEKLAKQYFGGWQRGEVPKHDYPDPRAPEKTQVDFVHKPGAVQSVINITYPVSLRPGEPDAIRARLMNTILGGYFNSRVNANLREGHAYTYGARTALNPNKLIGSFNATASVRNAVTDSSIIQFLYELNQLRDVKVPQKELQLVKNVLTGQFSMNLEEPETVAEFALNTARFGLAPDYYEKYLETLANVTAEEVQAMAKKYVRPDRAHILVVGNKDDVAERLKQFSPDGKVNFYDSFGDPVKAAGKVPDGMTAEKVIEDYINAVGGTSKIAELKDVMTAVTIKTGGPELKMTTWQTGEGKFAMEMTMNGQMMAKRVYDGTAAKESGMGGASRMLEGEELADTKENAVPFKEAKYKAWGYKLALKGVETINDKQAYVIEVTRPNGKVSTEYYDMATSLKIRELNMEGEGEEARAVTSDFDEYKPLNGVLFPYKMTIGGLFPVPMNAQVTDLKVNAGIEAGIFKL